METTKDPLATLDALISAGQAATPGDWEVSLVNETLVISPSRDVANTLGDYDTDECEQMATDATFIALAKNALPDLIALRAAYADQAEELAKLREALDGIYIYANDTLSGRADGGPDDREWQRAAVVEIRNRAREFASVPGAVNARLRALVEGKG